jgi:hypothetical protein
MGACATLVVTLPCKIRKVNSTSGSVAERGRSPLTSDFRLLTSHFPLSPLSGWKDGRHGCKAKHNRQLTAKFIWVFVKTFFLLARLGDFILLFPFDGTRPVAANNMLITMLSKVIDGSNGGRYLIAVKLLIGAVRELPG